MRSRVCSVCLSPLEYDHCAAQLGAMQYTMYLAGASHASSLKPYERGSVHTQDGCPGVCPGLSVLSRRVREFVILELG